MSENTKIEWADNTWSPWLGAHVVNQANGVRIFLKHPKGGDPSEWPEDLRVREMPQ